MSTNYFDTFIEVADDCPVEKAEVPVARSGRPTVASMQYEMIAGRPYELTSDDVIFTIHARRNGMEESARQREEFFSRGRPCLRASPLGQRYGWGIHSDSEGRVAIYAVESDAYAKHAGDEKLKHLKAMRSKRS